MKRLVILILLFVFTGNAFAEITGWWGMVSFRERYEETKYYTDYTFQDEPGKLRYTDTNTKTRIGYKFGFRVNISDQLWAGLTIRSGIKSVMWQDINNASGLAPGLQEAYLNWDTPYALLEMGKIPQNGNAMWDLYAAANQVDWRLYDPRDGIFNDRLSSLNGARISVPIDLHKKEASEIGGYKLPQPMVVRHIILTPRLIFHTDKTGGYSRVYNDSEQGDEKDLDWYVMLVGAKLEYNNLIFQNELDFDYGFPYRLGDKYKQDDKDSTYVDETLWGATYTLRSRALFNFLFQVGYGYNWRDSIYTAEFWDYKAGAEFKGYRLTGRYQHGIHEHEFGNYTGSKAFRDSWHLYLNKTIWDLDIQPRIIWFRTDIENVGVEKKQRSFVRMELTATARF